MSVLADPRRSIVLLLNPARAAEDGSIEWQAAMSLLSEVRKILAIRTYVVGSGAPMREQFMEIPTLDIDPLKLWQEGGRILNDAVGESDVVFVGGLSLDEEVMIAALNAAGHGYDVRLIADLSLSPPTVDRRLTYCRLALHGIPVITLRQAILEWTVRLQDEVLMGRVRQLLA